MLDNSSNQPSKFRTKNWIEINDQLRGAYNTNSDVRFKTTRLTSWWCDYSDAYILAKGRITITRPGNNAAARQANETNKGVKLQKCAPSINCKREPNNTEEDNAEDIDIVIPILSW